MILPDGKPFLDRPRKVGIIVWTLRGSVREQGIPRRGLTCMYGARVQLYPAHSIMTSRLN
jgi:hypothetical protein